MSAISHFFYVILFQPLTNALVFFYNTIAFQDLGIAIIFLTLAIRLLLFPFFHKSARQQTIMQHLQPKLKAIQQEHKADRVKQTEAMMALYREHQVNPFSGIFFLLIQIPVLITLYHIFLTSLSSEALAPALYSFVHLPETFNTTLLGLINLSSQSILMVVAAAIAQFFQGKLAMPKRQDPKAPLSTQEQISRNMVYVGPVLTIFIFFSFPAAVSLYWLASSLFSIVQQVVINKSLEKMEHWELFLKNLVEHMGFSDFKVEVDEPHRFASIVIYEQPDGFREYIPLFVESMNHLAQVIAQKRGEVAMFIDVNNYRKEREKLLSDLARAAARKVVATKESVSLPAMNSYERRLIHMELAGRPDVLTESEGTGRDRYVTIRLVGDDSHSATIASGSDTASSESNPA